MASAARARPGRCRRRGRLRWSRRAAHGQSRREGGRRTASHASERLGSNQSTSLRTLSLQRRATRPDPPGGDSTGDRRRRPPRRTPGGHRRGRRGRAARARDSLPRRGGHRQPPGCPAAVWAPSWSCSAPAPRRKDDAHANDHDRSIGRGRRGLAIPSRRRRSAVPGPGPARRAPDRRPQMREAHTELAQQRLTRKAWRLADKVADARDRGFSPRAYRRRVNDDPPRALARRVRVLRRDLRSAPPRRAAPRRLAGRPPPPRSRRSPPASPAATRAPTPATGSTASTSSRSPTWASVGGSGNPAAASEAEQNRRAAHALRARGRLALAGLRPLVVSGRMALRDEFPVLQRVAYLNAGTDGPIPRAATELVQRRARRGARGRARCGRTSSAGWRCRPTCGPGTRG